MRVPVILLTGFLGSGKTTVLNRLFRARPPGGRKFAIVVNEFGDVGIDGDLLPPGATRQVELPGGCVCCALVGELEQALVELLDSQPDLGCILLETTGIADPLPISWTLADQALADRVRLAAVATVVDPLHHDAHRTESPSVDAQVRYADILVVSKMDLIDSAKVPDSLVAELRKRNAFAPLIAVEPERVATELWRLLDDPELGSLGPSGVEGPRRAPADLPHSAAHERDWHTVSTTVRGVADLEELITALEALPASIVRLKGLVVAVDGESGDPDPALFAVHRVGARVSAERLGPPPDPANTRLVAIGRELDSADLDDAFERAVLR